jgi:multiple sugar transport system permease protein
MATRTMPTRNMNSLQIAKRRRDLLVSSAVTLFALIVLTVYLIPLAYGLVTSLQTKQQAADAKAPIIPQETVKFSFNGKSYDLYKVPLETGVRELALLKKERTKSTFIDPQNPNAQPIVWIGRWQTLEPVREVSLKVENYPIALQKIDFMRLLANTLFYALAGMVGTVISSSLVAYGFARFRFPFKNLLFTILIATIILPPAVTLVPTYFFFVKVLGWGGTWWPLIVPQFFANAYNVFLLRQYFMTIPREMEEAAMIDGAGPIRTFLRVIVPQAMPAITAVALFHFFFAWNDFFGPLIYISGKRELTPISIGLNAFNSLYGSEPQFTMAASIVTMILPVAIFFLAQRVFIQGIVITGVDK